MTPYRYWFVPVFLLCGTLTFGGVAYWQYSQSRRLVESGVAAQGTVLKLKYEASTNGKGGGVYYPIVSFNTKSGEKVEAKSRFGSSPPSFKQGDSVEIFYDEKNPKSWTINSFWDLYFISVIFGAFAAIMAAASVVVTFCMIVGKQVPGTFRSDRTFQSRKL